VTKNSSVAETARCFVSLNISLNHLRLVKIIENSTIRKHGYGILFVFQSNYDPILRHFQDKAIYWPKVAIFHTPAFDASVRDPCRHTAIIFIMEKLEWVANQW